MFREREPQFLVDWESRHRGWGEALAVLLRTRAKKAAFDWLLPDLDSVGTRLNRRAIFSSFLLHFAVILFCARVPMGWLFAFTSARQPAQPEQEAKLIYPVPVQAIKAYLPTLQPPGPGGKPGHGNRPDKPPPLGSTLWHPRFTVVSNPPHPDNAKQTIIQPLSPPELRIRQELNLPSIVLAGLTPLRMPLKMTLNSPARTHSVQRQQPVSPAVPVIPPDAMPPPLAPPTIQNPHLPIPVGSVAPPVLAQAKNSQPMAPALGGEAPDANQPGLIVLSATTGALRNLFGLPPGNRYGEFAISPTGGKPGAPGGEPGGVVGGGEGGSGAGGDSSAGVGSGKSGGGGGGAGNAGLGAFFSVKGGKLGGSGEGLPRLNSTLAVNMVFPITPPSIHVRENALIVSAGPIGGGGLDTYGVLRCAGVYTVYLPMPRVNWALEYCQESEAAAAESESRATLGTVQPVAGLVPPQPEKQFDFHRPPVPPLKANKLIVLKGRIEKDGSVSHLKVLEGVTQAADEAAMAAFARWKFKPALAGGRPVAVDFLVGIPATVPGR